MGYMKKLLNKKSANEKLESGLGLPTWASIPLVLILALTSLLMLTSCASYGKLSVTKQASLEAPCDDITPLPERATYRQLAAGYVDLVYLYQGCADR